MTTDLAGRVARAELVKRTLIVVTALLVTVALVLLLLLLSAVRSTQQEGSPTLKAISAQQDDIETAVENSGSLNEIALDCLTPKGACYQESLRRSAAEQAFAYYTAVCVDRPGSQSLQELRRCVNDLVDAEGDVDLAPLAP